jgi:hypothetical protein
MRRNSQEHDHSEFETVLMRRFHLTPGAPEYVVVKRRLSKEVTDQRNEQGRSILKGSRLTPKKKGEATHPKDGYKKQGFTVRTAESVSKKAGGKLSGTGGGKQIKKPSGHKVGNVRKRNRSVA